MHTAICHLSAALCTLGLLVAPLLGQEKKTAPRTENVIIVTLDGFRWQDFFGGADETLLDAKLGGVRDLAGLKKRYWRDTPEARRTAVLPFIWTTLAKQGQDLRRSYPQSPRALTNGLKFSYPGYSEMFCGFADPGIDSNAKKPNPNLSVLEFLHTRPAYRDRVAAFCTWDVFPFILRSEPTASRCMSPGSRLRMLPSPTGNSR